MVIKPVKPEPRTVKKVYPVVRLVKFRDYGFEPFKDDYLILAKGRDFYKIGFYTTKENVGKHCVLAKGRDKQEIENYFDKALGYGQGFEQ